MTHFTDIMVDLETTDINPQKGAILQIAAVKFNLDTNEVSPHFFDRCLKIPHSRRWSESTNAWWHNDKTEILQDICNRSEPWQQVIQDFADYCYPVDSLRFWSKPSHFDYQFLQCYFEDAELAFPFRHYRAMDLRSFINGLHYPEKVPNVNVPFDGPAHNAIWDTLHQLKLLLHHTHELKGNNLIINAEVQHENTNQPSSI